MNRQESPSDRPATPEEARAPRRAYQAPVVRTEPLAEPVVLASSTGCGDGIDEANECGFAG